MRTRTKRTARFIALLAVCICVVALAVVVSLYGARSKPPVPTRMDAFGYNVKVCHQIYVRDEGNKRRGVRFGQLASELNLQREVWPLSLDDCVYVLGEPDLTFAGFVEYHYLDSAGAARSVIIEFDNASKVIQIGSGEPTTVPTTATAH